MPLKTGIPVLQGGEDVKECELCEKKSAIFDFNRICCRVRFVMSLPTREMRAGWLERWKKKDGQAMAEEIEREVTKRWNERKKPATRLQQAALL